MPAKASTRTLLVCLGLLAMTGLLYWPVLQAGFIIFDDPFYVVDNAHVNHGFTRDGLAWAFQAEHFANWHPLTWLSHMLDGQLYGLNPAGHHATSVLLHMFNAVLVFLVLLRLTGAFWRAATVAALFAWHPLHVESVAWIAERKDVLCAFFFLGSIWFYAGYARALENRTSQSNKLILYLSALICCSLALLAKPMAVTLPCVLLLLDCWPLGRWQGTEGAARPVSLPRLLGEKTPFFLLSAFCCWFTLQAQHRGNAIIPINYFPLPDRLMNAVTGYCGYLQKTIWPANLALLYPRVFWTLGLKISACIAVLLGVTVIAVRFFKSRPYWLIGWLWYLGMLVPVIGLVSIGGIAMADRYTYLPLLGIFIIACWSLSDLSTTWPHREKILGGLAAIILTACLAATRSQLNYWRNDTLLWTHTLAVTKNNYIAHANYAMVLEQQGRWEQARRECEETIRLQPDYEWAHSFLAELLLRLGHPDEAEKSALTSLKLRPDSTHSYLVLGQIFLDQNQPAKAAAILAEGLKYPPPAPMLEFLLGQALGEQGKLAEAVPHLLAATRLLPELPEPHYYCAVAFFGLHQVKEAVEQYRQTLAVAPDDSRALNNLAWILATDSHAELRNGPDAVRLALRACAATHNQQPVMLETLAAAYAESGRFDDAIDVAKKARDLALAAGEINTSARAAGMLRFFEAKKPFYE